MRLVLLFGVVVATAVPASAHYHILLPDRLAVKAGEKVALTYVFGHPFEHDLFDTEKPVRATLYAPDGTATDILPQFQKTEMTGRDGKRITAFRGTITVPGRGDYTVLVESPPVWMADEKRFLRDTVRVNIHAQTQNGWDVRHTAIHQFAMTPLTRPYGVRAGTAFQVSVTPAEGSVSHLVEVERFNAEPPRGLPPDEFITLGVKTDPAGTATCTLPEAGWWSLTAVRRLPAEAKPPTRERDGQSYPVLDRATLWVPVDERVPLRPAD